MRTTVSLSISCRKNVFLLKFSNKNTFFPHEMDKLMVVLKSIKTLNKERRPLAIRWDLFFIFEKTLNKYLGLYIWTQIWNPQLKPRWFDIKKKLLSGTILVGSTVWVKLATKISYLEPKYQTQLHYIHLPYTYLFLLNETPTPYYMYYFLHQDILIVFCFYHEINGVFLSCRNISTKIIKILRDLPHYKRHRIFKQTVNLFTYLFTISVDWNRL